MKIPEYKIETIGKMKPSQIKETKKDVEYKRFMKKVQHSLSNGLIMANYRKRQAKILREIRK